MQSEYILIELWKICIQVARLGKLAILCVAPQAYYCFLASMTVSNCKALDVRAFYDLFSKAFRPFQDSCIESLMHISL